MKKIVLTVGCVIILFSYTFISIGIFDGSSSGDLSLLGIATSPHVYCFDNFGADKFSFWSLPSIFVCPTQFLFRYSMLFQFITIAIILLSTYQKEMKYIKLYRNNIILIFSIISLLLVIATISMISQILNIYYGELQMTRLLILPLGSIVLIIGATQKY